MSFNTLSELRNSRGKFDNLMKEVEKISNPQSNFNKNDEREWKPTVDKAGNGYAVIRFLPAPDGEDLPWAKLYTHAFQASGGWYIENSLTTLGQKDPVSEHNSQLWNSGVDSDKEVARKQKRKLSYYSNVYVVKDPSNPANEGKVFLFRYGKKIFDKITAAMQPEFEDEQAINPFDFWAGANFKIKIKKVAGYWNYDSSEFAAPAPLLDDDDAMEAVWKQEYSLAELIAPDQFKSYEDLKKRLDYVLGLTVAPKRQDPEVIDEDNNLEDLSEGRAVVDTTPSSVNTDEDEEDALSYFAKLAEN